MRTVVGNQLYRVRAQNVLLVLEAGEDVPPHILEGLREGANSPTPLKPPLSLPVGGEVELCNLRSQPKLNGSMAEILGVDQVYDRCYFLGTETV